MKKITRNELEIILRKHKLWLIDHSDGQRADLRDADLLGADLRWADLRWADLQGADLRMANLWGADLRMADLRMANLLGAKLHETDFFGANLQRADLRGIDLREAKNVNYPIACPEKGSFTGFKKANGYIVELLIPDDALRSSATARMCRCSKAKVISITELDGSSCDITSIPSDWDGNFIYTIGQTVEVKDFDTDRWREYTPGIHFFITRQEAVDY